MIDFSPSVPAQQGIGATHHEWHILCDFDGTISTQDVTDTLLQSFALPGWQEIEELWQQGKIGSRECMAKQIALLDASKEELDECLSTITLDPDFHQFLQLTRQWNIPLSIVSDGLDYAIQSILQQQNITLPPVFANHLQQEGDRRWSLQFPWENPHCLTASGTCKCAIANQLTSNKFLMIGDGRSDFCVSHHANHVFAKQGLLAECQKVKLPYSAMPDFSTAQQLLHSLLHSDMTVQSTHKESLLMRETL